MTGKPGVAQKRYPTLYDPVISVPSSQVELDVQKGEFGCSWTAVEVANVPLDYRIWQVSLVPEVSVSYT